MYFCDLEKSGTFGVPYLNLWGAGAELFRSLGSETVWGKLIRMGFLYVGDVLRCNGRATRSRMHVVGYSLRILCVKLIMVYLSGLSVVWPIQSGVHGKSRWTLRL
jgi:hypothetical protein